MSSPTQRNRLTGSDRLTVIVRRCASPERRGTCAGALVADLVWSTDDPDGEVTLIASAAAVRATVLPADQWQRCIVAKTRQAYTVAGLCELPDGTVTARLRLGNLYASEAAALDAVLADQKGAQRG